MHQTVLTPSQKRRVEGHTLLGRRTLFSNEAHSLLHGTRGRGTLFSGQATSLSLSFHCHAHAALPCRHAYSNGLATLTAQTRRSQPRRGRAGCALEGRIESWYSSFRPLRITTISAPAALVADDDGERWEAVGHGAQCLEEPREEAAPGAVIAPCSSQQIGRGCRDALPSRMWAMPSAGCRRREGCSRE